MRAIILDVDKKFCPKCNPNSEYFTPKIMPDHYKCNSCNYMWESPKMYSKENSENGEQFAMDDFYKGLQAAISQCATFSLGDNVKVIAKVDFCNETGKIVAIDLTSKHPIKVQFNETWACYKPEEIEKINTKTDL